MSRLSDRDLDRLLDGDDLPTDRLNSDSPLGKLTQLRDAFARLQGQQQASEHAAPRSPAQFHWDRLEVHELLGTGGFGEVYRAWDPTLERFVALKLRRKDAGFAPAAGRVFIDEARRMARVRHPNVIAVLGANIADGRAGIWTELIDGETLQRRIEIIGAMVEAELLIVLKALAEALAILHEAGLVHGDIKPSNVMRDRSNGQYVLMDFGAGAWLDDKGQAWLTSGSRHYMAPEHERGDAIDVRADVYALGAVAHAAACGVTRLREANASRQLPVRGLSPELNQLLGEMLDAAPTQRPQAREVAARVNVLLNLPNIKKQARLRRLGWSILGFATVLSAVGFAAAMLERRDAIVERNRALDVQNFLQEILANPNPYQNHQSSNRVDHLFEHAVAQLDQQAVGDDETRARLLQQFGRSLHVMGRDESALKALLKAESMLMGKVDETHPTLRATRDHLTDLLRVRREFERAGRQAEQQLRLCQPVAKLSAVECLGIENNWLEWVGFSGDWPRAVHLTEAAIARSNQMGWQNQYDAIFQHYLLGVWRHQQGESTKALDAFITLTKATANHAPASHPGLFTDAMWLAWCAFERGDVELALALNQVAREGRESRFAPDSRYVMETRLQQGLLQAATQDLEAAKGNLRAVLQRQPEGRIHEPLKEQADLWLALIDRSHALDVARWQAIAERIDSHKALPGDAELSVWMLAHHLQSADSANAKIWLARAKQLHGPPMPRRTEFGWQWLQGKRLESNQSNANTEIEVEKLRNELMQTNRNWFDPVQASWVLPQAQWQIGEREQVVELLALLKARIQQGKQKPDSR